MIDALNVIYEQKETRSFIKLNLLALVFTLAGFSAFLLAIASIIVLPLVFSPFGFGSRSSSAGEGWANGSRNRSKKTSELRLMDEPLAIRRLIADVQHQVLGVADRLHSSPRRVPPR